MSGRESGSEGEGERSYFGDRRRKNKNNLQESRGHGESVI